VSDEGASTAVRRGRPRDETIDAAILDATIDELIDRGYLGLTMEAVAARAGVAKTTLYRRWPSTTELAIAALASFEPESPEPPDGPVREQLLFLLDGMRRKWTDERFAAVIRRVTGDGQSAPELYQNARDRLVEPHIRRMHTVLRRAADEGIIRPDVELTWVRQLLVSPISATTLTFKPRVTRRQVEFTVDAVLRGLAP
jgi:AcrR family transcriptional regulator